MNSHPVLAAGRHHGQTLVCIPADPLQRGRRVTNKLGVEVASNNNFLENELGLAVKVSDHLALSLGYAVRHNTDPPAAFKKTDTLSTVNLVYEVK
jgi:putative salt-induced outer membrane protein YdiY